MDKHGDFAQICYDMLVYQRVEDFTSKNGVFWSTKNAKKSLTKTIQHLGKRTEKKLWWVYSAIGFSIIFHGIAPEYFDQFNHQTFPRYHVASYVQTNP